MAILKVARLGHPVLRKVAAPVPVSEIRLPETQRLIDDMIETMREHNGAGLAATQVHTLKQIAVIEVLSNPRYPDAPQIPLTVIVNPIVTPLTDAMEEGWEGCLSIPDLRGLGRAANQVAAPGALPPPPPLRRPVAPFRGAAPAARGPGGRPGEPAPQGLLRTSV